MSKRLQIAPDYAAFVASSHRAGVELQQVTLTWHGFLVGVVFSFCLATGAPSKAMLLKTHLALDFNTPGAIFLFLLLIGPINLLLKLTGRNPARA